MNIVDFFYNHKPTHIKLLFTTCLLSLVIVNILAYTSPQTGYELSYYASTPFLVFIFIGLAILCGICILIQQALSGGYNHSKVWLGGFLLLLLIRTIILYLPYIRNYYIWRGDNSTHFGMVRDYILTGQISVNDFYPITHILLSQIQLVTSIPLNLVINYSTALLSILFILSIYLLTKFIFNDDKILILSLAIVGCAIFSIYELYVMPNGWSCLFLPFVIYIVLRSMASPNLVAYKILTPIVAIIFPFFHPLSTILLILLILVILVVDMVYRNIDSSTFTQSNYWKFKLKSPFRIHFILLHLVVIISVVWLPWLFTFRLFDLNIRSSITGIFSKDTVDVIGSMAASAEKMDFNLMDVLILLIKQNGDELILIAIFLIGMLIYLKNWRQSSKFEYGLLISFISLIFGLIYLAYLSGIVPGLKSIHAERVIFYIVLFTPIFAGIFFSYVLSIKKSIVIVTCVLLMMVPSTLGLFALIPSPYVHRPTPDMTEMDLQGMSWTFGYKDTNLPFGEIMSPVYRYADVLMGMTERTNRIDIERRTLQIPDHFGYDRNHYLGDAYTENIYAVITKLDTILYDTVYHNVERFQSNDFDRLRIDPTVNIIYSNNESTVYLVGRDNLR